MFWFKKVTSRLDLLQKIAVLNGEWFIDDGGHATFADGDIGDLNHEAYALQSMVPDELWEKYDNGTLNKKERKLIGEDFLKYMENGGEARDYMVEHMGWIRVHGNNFQIMQLDENKLHIIVNFIQEQIWDDDDLKNEEIWIEELSTGKLYDFYANQLINADSTSGGLSQILSIKSGPKQKRLLQQEEEYKKNIKNNELMQEGLNLITYIRQTLGDNRYRQLIIPIIKNQQPEKSTPRLRIIAYHAESWAKMNDNELSKNVNIIASQPIYSGLSKNWLQKLSSYEFSPGEVMKDEWNSLVMKEQDKSNIHFNLENNDDVGPIRRISISLKDDTIYDNQVYFVQMMSAGGDWEYPVYYFRIQVKSGYMSGMFIFIPNKKQGNHSLVSTKNGFSAAHSDGSDIKIDNDKRLCWKSLNYFLQKLVQSKKYIKTNLDAY